MTTLTNSTILQFLTTTRLFITPYLPQPLISFMNSTDDSFDTDEASMIALFSISLGFLLLFCIGTAGMIRNRNNIHYNDDNVMNLTKKTRDVSSTVLLCGPSGSGKTVLFHILTNQNATTPENNGSNHHPTKSSSSSSPLLTVTSLLADEGFLPSEDNKKPIRIIDYPGHSTLRSSLVSTALPEANRIILLLDSTKSVADCANLLYTILTNRHIHQLRKRTTIPIPILISCNKSDLPLAKNCKRIKLQLRTELERMRQLKSSKKMLEQDHHQEEHDVSLLGDGDDDDSKKPLDLDTCEGLPCQLHFVSVSCVTMDRMAVVRRFVKDGTIEDSE